MASKPKSQPPEARYEDHLAALEKVVADLEGDALSLEASIERYQEGVAHLAACRRILDAAEQRLAQLSQGPEGVVETPLRIGENGLEDAGGPPPPVGRARLPAQAHGGEADLPF